MSSTGIGVPKRDRFVAIALVVIGASLILLSLVLGPDVAARLPVPPKVTAWLQLYLKLIGAFLIVVGLVGRYVNAARISERADRWLEINHRSEKILASMLILYIAVYAGFTFHRHDSFNSSALDLAIQDQVVWNTSQGRFFEESIEGRNYLGDHFQPLMALLALPYRVYPSVYWLLIFQTVCLALGGIPVFRLARREFGSSLAGLVFAAVYLLYPAIGYINRFDFHFEVVVIPLLLAAWDALAENNLKLASVWLILALFGKEEIGLTVAMVGLAAVLVMKRVRFGLIWFATGATFSLAALFILIPLFRGEPSDTLSRYAWLGANPVQMVQRLVFEPIYVLRGIQRLGWFYMFGQLFGPVAGLNLLSPVSLLLTAPGLAYNLLSSFWAQHSAYFQYVAVVVPGIFIGAIHGLSRLARGVARRLDRYVATWDVRSYELLGLALVMTFGVFAFIIDNPMLDRGVVPNAWTHAPNESTLREAMALIPNKARLFTTNQYGPHVSHRRRLEVYWMPGSEVGLRESDIVLLNLQDFRLVNPVGHFQILQACAKQGFGVTYEKDGVVILERERGDQSAISDLIEKWIPSTG